MDVFISYQNDSQNTANQIVEYLEENGRKCWIAPRDVGISYAGDIVDAISNCKIFVLLLTQKACYSVHVLNEIEQAYKYFKEGKTIIIPVQLEECALSKDIDYYIARIQRIDAFTTPLFDAELELIKKIDKYLGEYIPTEIGKVPTNNVDNRYIQNIQQTQKEQDQERIANRYYDVDDKYEKKRLLTEGKMLLPYEKSIVNDYLLKDRNHLNGLIVSCMYAHGIMDKYNLDQFDSIIGLCYNEKATFEANYDFKSDKCKFFTQDVESYDFEDNLKLFMEERGVDKFDYMDITMGFLDWKNPFKVVKTLKRFMKPNCRIYVRDVDDSVLMAFPDEKDIFKKFFTFYHLDPLGGYRQSGRRVFSYFKKIGAKTINLVKKGIDTTDMDYDQKERLFHSYFGFIPNDFRISYNAHPEKEEYKEIIDWCDLYYNDLDEEFMNDDFYYNSGYFLYAIEM